MDLAAHRPFVVRIARKLAARLPANVELDDLVQVGMVALWRCSTAFQPDKGVAFEAYARGRVLGAMLDELREVDPLSRGDRTALKVVRAAEARLEAHGERVTVEGLAAESRLSPEDVARVQALGRALAPADLAEAAEVAGETADPFEAVSRAERLAAIMAAIDNLPERTRRVMLLRYSDGVPNVDIAAMFGLTGGRITQLCDEAITAIRLECMHLLEPADVPRDVRLDFMSLITSPVSPLRDPNAPPFLSTTV